MIKHHFAITKNPDGTPNISPLREWFRVNAKDIQGASDFENSTSHEIRRFLKKKGWEMEESTTRVLMIRPDEKGDISYADTLFDDEDDTQEDELAEAQEVTFGLERDMQAALRANIAQLESGLQIIDGGKEQVTEAGRIDITACDDKGQIVVIELKAGDAPQTVITQILAYMTAVTEKDNKPVRGILVAGDFDKRIVLAARAIPNISLKKYSFQFTFESVK
jgi:hypothetical protein